MSLYTSRDKGVITVSTEEASWPIIPMTVLSPVLKQSPFPDPAMQDEPENAMFLASNMLVVCFT